MPELKILILTAYFESYKYVVSLLNFATLH